MRRRVNYTEEQLVWFRENYPVHGLFFCAKHLGRTEQGIKQLAAREGIRRFASLAAEGDRFKCSCCGLIKELSEFTIRNKNGRSQERRKPRRLCKQCRMEAQRAYYKRNREAVVLRQGMRHKRLRASDPNFVLLQRLRVRIRMVLKKGKTSKSLVYVGCSLEELRSHIESLFKPGMTWENMRLWHVDHIRPCSWFDLSRDEEVRACFHYSNLQPLWKRENLAKGNRFAG